MKLLIVVDYQADFVNGKLPCGEYAEKIDEKLAEKVRWYQKNGEVVFTKDTHVPREFEKSVEGRLFPMHCEKETPGWALYGETAKAAGNDYLCVEKSTYGSFDLLEVIEDMGAVEQIEMAGIATNICLLHNVFLVYNRFPNVPVIVDAACCASFDESQHNAALDMMAGIGVTIVNR